MPKFQPKGEKAEWKLIVDYVVENGFPPDHLVTWKDLEEVIGHKIGSRTSIQIARKTLLRDHQIALATVPTVGYRIAHPREHTILANGQIRKTQVYRTTARELVNYTNLQVLNFQEKKTHDYYVTQVAILDQLTQRHVDGLDRADQFKYPVILVASDEEGPPEPT